MHLLYYTAIPFSFLMSSKQSSDSNIQLGNIDFFDFFKCLIMILFVDYLNTLDCERIFQIGKKFNLNCLSFCVLY